MSVNEIRNRISTIEEALKETGPGSAPIANAIVDALKEIANTLDIDKKPPCGEPLSGSSAVPMVPEYRGRKFRD
jgi:hypothetical protein